MTQHQDFVEDALELIAEDGRPVVLTKQTNSGSGFDPEPTVKQFGVMAIQGEFDISEVNGLVQSTDKQFTIGNEVVIDSAMRLRDYEADAHDRIPMGELPDDFNEDEFLIADYAIGHLEPEQPGSTIIYYEVYARI